MKRDLGFKGLLPMLMAFALCIGISILTPVLAEAEETSYATETTTETTTETVQIVKASKSSLAAPVLVSATLSGDTEITVTWKKVAGSDGYIVYRKVSGTKKWTKVATLEGTKTLSYTDGDLKAATEYTYTVAAYQTVGKKQVAGSKDSTGKAMCTAITVSAGSKPWNNRYVKTKNYNSSTKHYFLIRSYLEYFADLGGGKLILKKGTYNVPCTLYIPSNVQIVLNDGVTLNKTDTVGKAPGLKPAAKLFVFADTYLKDKKNGAAAYNGIHDVTITSTGTATINMPTASGYIFSLSHNSNINISNITMNMTGKDCKAVYISGCTDVTLDNCSITGVKTTSYGVWIDAPIKATTQYFTWAKLDNTVCKNITINGCTFKSMIHAVYTNRFLSGKYHTNIKLTGNSFSSTSDDAIRVMNWKKAVIQKNTFTSIGKGAVVRTDMVAAIRMFGAYSPSITGNTFNKVERAVHFAFTKNSNSKLASQGTTVNKVTLKNLQTIAKKNTFKKLGDYFVSIIGPKDTELTRVWIPDTVNEYTMTTASTPYRNQYVLKSDYNETSRQYYTFRSYLEQLERDGGGTLTLKAGTYNLSFRLNIPSNVTLNLEAGVIINCSYTDASVGALFNLVNSADLDAGLTYTEYNGAHDITIKGPDKGTATINMHFAAGSAIKFAHTQNVTIQNITFKNMNASVAHFIECDASKNVLIEKNSFMNYKYVTEETNREAINLDIPDKNTNGFSSSYTSYDCTANTEIVIRNNTFTNLACGVGTHMYTPDHPHTNITIENNTFKNMNCYAIRAENWDGFTIKGNTIDGVDAAYDEGQAIFFMGAMNATVTGNTIANATYFLKARAAYYTKDFFTGKSTFSKAQIAALLKYKMVKNDFTEADCEKMGFYDNTFADTLTYACVKYKNSDTDSFVSWDMEKNSDFVIGEDSISYMGTEEAYVDKDDPIYDFRVIQSYLKQIEKLGGGSLTIQAGTYYINNSLYIPSNTTLILEEGATLVKTGDTSKFVITTIAYEDKDSEGTFGTYKAASNITIQGSGTINLNGNDAKIAIKIPQADNVTISGLTFKGGTGSEYIDVYSSRNVTIKNCKFIGKNDTERGINLVNYYKDVVCKTVTVSGCTFSTLSNAIITKAGTKITADSGLYHSGISIAKCTFSKISGHNINLECWAGVSITDNTFNGIDEIDASGYVTSNSGAYAIRLGYYYGDTLTITGNTLKNYYVGMRVPEDFVEDISWDNTFTNCLEYFIAVGRDE